MSVHDRKHFHLKHTNGGALTITGDVFVNIIDRNTSNDEVVQFPPQYLFGFLPMSGSAQKGVLVDEKQLAEFGQWLVENFGGGTHE